MPEISHAQEKPRLWLEYRRSNCRTLSLGDEQSEVNLKEPLGVGGIIDFGKRECAFSREQVIVGQTHPHGKRALTVNGRTAWEKIR